MKIIAPNNPKLEYRNEYDIFCDVYYDGKKFSGIVKDELEQTEYSNGYAHGLYITRYKSGNVQTTAYFQYGEEIESTSYYESTKIMSTDNQKESTLWSEEGKIIREWNLTTHVGKTYFRDGSIKHVYARNKMEWRNKYFASDGELVMTIYPEKAEKEILYNEKALIENFSDLLNRDYPELQFDDSYLSAENQRLHLLWMWLWKVFDENKDQYFSILNDLIKHKDNDVLDNVALIIAFHKFEPYIEKENEENRICYTLIQEKRKYQDENFPNREYKRID